MRHLAKPNYSALTSDNMINIFLVSHMLLQLLLHSLYGLSNELKNMGNSENVCHVALGNVR